MEKNKRKSRSGGNNFVVQGSILAIAGIIVRLIGMFYRIPLVNIIGKQGSGYYTSAYSIYSIVLLISSYSMPVAVSKMIAVRLSRKEYQNSYRILKVALVYATIVGGLAAVIMWFGADAIAAFNNMPYSSLAIKTLAPTVWVMAYLGVLRGYFQGHGTMIPTAISQVAEQVVNAAVSIVAAMSLFKYGESANLIYNTTEYSYAYGAAGGTIGTGAGAFTALLLFGALLLMYLPVMRRKARKDKTQYQESNLEISRTLFFTIVPIVLSSTIYNVSSVVDNGVYGQVMGKLEMSSAEIATTWGIYMGQYHLLFNIPVGVANALSSSLIPSLTMAVAEGKRRAIREKIGTVVRFTMIIAIPSAAGMMALAEPISNLLFRSSDNTMLVHLLWYGSSAVVVYSLSTVTNAILQGLNHMHVPMINASISLGIHLVVLYVMLSVFHLGISGVVYSSIIFALIVCILNGIAIRRIQRYRQEVKKTFIIPTIAALIMGAGAWLVFQVSYKVLVPFAGAKIGNAVAVMIAILVAVVIYIVGLFKLGGLDEEELLNMPKGHALVGIAAKFHLI